MNLSIEAQVAIGFGIVAFGVFLFLTRSVYRRLPKRMSSYAISKSGVNCKSYAKNKKHGRMQSWQLINYWMKF
ncbi:MAG: hypothetical protein LC687_01860 [Actinobacteria bacterium]|nr:hypothetical protein [Actinomycetota bacterium]